MDVCVHMYCLVYELCVIQRWSLVLLFAGNEKRCSLGERLCWMHYTDVIQNFV